MTGAVRAGRDAVVAVAVATLWTSPEAVRPVDTPAIAPQPDVRAWVAAMDPASRADLTDRTLTQLLLGETVLVEEVRGDWTRVIAVEQPAGKLDPRGYPGWLPTAHLAPVPADDESTGRTGAGRPVVVDATAAALRDGPAGDVILAGVSMGTRLTTAGAVERGWLPVRLPGADEPAWVRQADVAPAPTHAPSRKEVLAVAERLIDVPYVWGGLSAYGVDCSGLVHLAHRRLGVQVPRDADDQAQASEPLPTADGHPGDLYFFARDGKHVHHVGLVAGDEHMVHASFQLGRVVHERLEGERVGMLTGVHRTVD